LSSSNASLRLNDEAELGAWTVRKQLESAIAGDLYCAKQQNGLDLQKRQSSKSAPDSSFVKQTCSVAVNTSLFWPSIGHDSSSISVDQGVSGPHLDNHVQEDEDPTGSSCYHQSSSEWSADSNLHNLSFTEEHVEQPGNNDQHEVSNAMEYHDWIYSSHVDGSMCHENHEHSIVDESYCTPPMPLFVNPSEESVDSEMIVDMLEYESPSPEK